MPTREATPRSKTEAIRKIGADILAQAKDVKSFGDAEALILRLHQQLARDAAEAFFTEATTTPGMTAEWFEEASQDYLFEYIGRARETYFADEYFNEPAVVERMELTIARTFVARINQLLDGPPRGGMQQ